MEGRTNRLSDHLAGGIQESVNRPTEQQVAQWHQRLVRTALRLTGDRDQADDLAQQAVCQGLAAWERFDGQCLPMTWLHRILLNCFRDRVRRDSVRRAEELDEWAVAAPSDGTGPEAVEKEEELACLRMAINQLPDDLRRPLVAAVLDGHSYQEVAELLGIPAGTVASRIHKARRQLLETLRQTFGEE
ncbi:MAG: ECF RNA polymerase sigma factor SigE [Phycisphaerae bacterium]|nr:ECF RNA polymerase sigma factor SigE [Phycisphaerae bacterium]